MVTGEAAYPSLPYGSKGYIRGGKRRIAAHRELQGRNKQLPVSPCLKENNEQQPQEAVLLNGRDSLWQGALGSFHA